MILSCSRMIYSVYFLDAEVMSKETEFKKCSFCCQVITSKSNSLRNYCKVSLRPLLEISLKAFSVTTRMNLILLICSKQAASTQFTFIISTGSLLSPKPPKSRKVVSTLSMARLFILAMMVTEAKVCPISAILPILAVLRAYSGFLGVQELAGTQKILVPNLRPTMLEGSQIQFIVADLPALESPSSTTECSLTFLLLMSAWSRVLKSSNSLLCYQVWEFINFITCKKSNNYIQQGLLFMIESE